MKHLPSVFGLMLFSLALAAFSDEPAVPATAPNPATAAIKAIETKVCIAHRGASAYAPEHTLASYRRALTMKADFVEQDIGVTKDGTLVCLHDMTLERTTNVGFVYPDRYFQRNPVNPDLTGKSKKSWRLVDFKLDEIRKLDAGTWFDPSFAGEKIPTFQEAIDLVKGKAGLYVELKDPEFYNREGHPVEKMLLKILKDNGLDKPEEQARTPVFIQSFSPQALQKVRELEGETYPLVLLISDGPTGRPLLSDAGLAQLALYAKGIGPSLTLLMKDLTRVAAAKKLGLVIHPYTVNLNNVPQEFVDAQSYIKHLLYDVGVDGVFTDNPDLFPR